MTFTDLAFHTVKNHKPNHQEAMDELAERYRPKIIGQYRENGHTVTVFEAAHASGCECGQFAKPKIWVDSHEL